MAKVGGMSVLKPQSSEDQEQTRHKFVDETFKFETKNMSP
jgi:hypothetical protein